MASGFTVAVLWTKNFFFLFDSHSRNEDGTISNENLGTSILLKFSSLVSLEHYIYEIYFPFANSGTLQYEVQFVIIEKCGDFSTHNLKRKAAAVIRANAAKRKAIYREATRNVQKQELLSTKYCLPTITFPNYGNVKEIKRVSMTTYYEIIQNY